MVVLRVVSIGVVDVHWGIASLIGVLIFYWRSLIPTFLLIGESLLCMIMSNNILESNACRSFNISIFLVAL
jgi:hypothetical protein